MRPRVVALAGPTGVGKTEIGVAVARACGAEVISADSRQVYRRLDIGSAKPTGQQRREVPHFLIDVVEVDEAFDCARFRELALEAIEDVSRRGRRVLLVGGTGLYLKVLRDGLFEGPPRQAALRARLALQEEDEPGALYRRLREVDPRLADRLHARDRVRVVRALEVYEITGRPMSEWQADHGFRQQELDVLTIGLAMPRARLHQRIDARCAAMVDAGLRRELEDVYAAGFDPRLPPLQSPGYREIGEHLRGLCDLDAAVERMSKATRRLAKRQRTWFRADSAVVWMPPEADAIARDAAAFWEEGRRPAASAAGPEG